MYLFKKVLKGVTGIAHFIAAFYRTQLNRVFVCLYNVLLASKGSNYSEFIFLSHETESVLF